MRGLYVPFNAMSERLSDSTSLQGAVRAIAAAWRCPPEALSTEQNDPQLWFVLGPEGQHCGHIETA